MRLFFALLIACLAMPAVAAPPCAPVAPAHGMHKMMHHAPEKQVVPNGHECIGCIAPIDGLGRTPAIIEMRRDRPIAQNDRAFPRSRDCPATPPPKPLA